MKCSDIPDKSVLEFLALHQGRWSTHGEGHSMPTVQDAMPPGTPFKLQLAKMRQMQKRGFVGGCGCGCRGDWEITDTGLEFIDQKRAKKYTGYGENHGTVYKEMWWEGPDLHVVRNGVHEIYKNATVSSIETKVDGNIIGVKATFVGRVES